jgi:predicted GNAT family acetyltransferase
MEPEISQDRCGLRISAFVNGKEIGYLTYRVDDNLMNIEHTVVDPEFRGQGIAEKMVDQAIRFAREQGLQLTATCSYAAKKLEEKKV